MEEKENRPLWMPPGSVRAIIALIAIGTTCYMGASTGDFVMPEFMSTVVAVVVGFYFGNRSKA